MSAAPESSTDIDELALRVLHGQAAESQRAELARLLADSPEARRRFLDHTVLHSQLASAAKAGAFADNTERFFRNMEHAPEAKPRRFLRFWIPAAAAAVVAASLVAIPLLPVPATAALDRVIAAMEKAVDRTYRIEVLEPARSGTVENRSDRGRYPVSSHLDGATLWLRGPGQFVLRQSLPDGESRFLGSDGIESWSVRGAGAVQVSEDPERFGGGLVAKRREFACLDLKSQLDDLKRLYQLDWLDRPDHGLWKLRGIRKASGQGGAREIELWFEPRSGLLQRMILRQLPQGNGGPRSIALTLESSARLPPDFFKPTHPRNPGT